MVVVRDFAELKRIISSGKILNNGCFADTGFLYALSYVDDKYFERATNLFEMFSDHQIPIYVNVISRLEFVDLIFRKQVTLGCIELFEDLGRNSVGTPLFKLLKNIRDQNTSIRKNGYSFKVGEKQLKKLKNILQTYGNRQDWLSFCHTYAGLMLQNEWQLLEEDFDLRFVELLEGQMTELFNEPLHWADMVQLMGGEGLRGPDAMIVNLFKKSKISLLVTTDSDIEDSLSQSSEDKSKVLFLL